MPKTIVNAETSRHIYELHKQGFRTGLIAEKLGIGLNTVRDHVRKQRELDTDLDNVHLQRMEATTPLKREQIPRLYQEYKNGSSLYTLRKQTGAHEDTLYVVLQAYERNNCSLENIEIYKTLQIRRKDAYVPSDTQSSHKSIKRRLDNPNRAEAKYYEGKVLCRRWRFGEEGKTGLECFYQDMGERPVGTSCDRIDNDLGYTCGKCAECRENGWPSNCRWANPQTQVRNRSNTKTVYYMGQVVVLAELIDRLRPEFNQLSSVTRIRQIKTVAKRFASGHTDTLSDEEIERRIKAIRLSNPDSNQGKGGGGSKPGDRRRGCGRAKDPTAEAERRLKISQTKGQQSRDR